MDCERMKKYTQEEERRRQRRRVVQMMFDNTLNVDSTGSKVTAHDLNQRILKAVVLKFVPPNTPIHSTHVPICA